MINQWTSPALNKIGALVFDPDIRPMLAGGKTLDLRDVLDSKKVVLVNLSKGLLGEGASSLMGAFLVARFQSVALSRANSQKRYPFYLYLDEFQNYTTDNIKDILTESRKYGLSMIFAHQYLKQIPEEIQSAVINTAGIIASFRVGYQDAKILAKEMFPSPNFQEERKDRLAMKLDGTWPKFDIDDEIERTNWDNQAQHLSSLKPRGFWVKLRGSKAPTKRQSFDMPDVQVTRQIESSLEELENCSGKRYGRWKASVLRRIGDQKPNSSQTFSGEDDSSSSKDIPLWDS